MSSVFKKNSFQVCVLVTYLEISLIGLNWIAEYFIVMVCRQCCTYSILHDEFNFFK